MKVLELFKGSGSISEYFENTDNEIISLDIVSKYLPTICCDIMEWDYKEYPVGHLILFGQALNVKYLVNYSIPI